MHNFGEHFAMNRSRRDYRYLNAVHKSNKPSNAIQPMFPSVQFHLYRSRHHYIVPSLQGIEFKEQYVIQPALYSSSRNS